MFHLDNSSGINIMPTVQTKKSQKPLWFTEGGNFNSPSYPGADWFNIVQAELLNVLSEGGITPDKQQFNQLAMAIKKIISNNRVTPTSASISSVGVVKLSSAVNSTSETEAATPKAVKITYDLAEGAVKKTGDTITGELVSTATNAIRLKSKQKDISSLLQFDGERLKFRFTDPNNVNGSANELKPLSINAQTGDVNFCHKVTVTGIPILKEGDFGVGTTNLPFLADFNSFDIKNGTYWAFGAGTPKPTLNAPPESGNTILTVTVRNHGKFAISFDVVENTGMGPRKWVAEHYIIDNNVIPLNWVEVITTSNIGNYKNGIGVDQRWYNLANERKPNIIYTNTTGRPICVVVTKGSYNPRENPKHKRYTIGNLIVDDVNVISSEIFQSESSTSATSATPAMSYAIAIVPSGSKYLFELKATHNVKADVWNELR
ncbi:phage tail protein [Orbaceae bacterium ESL0721]|nr:phage tail protein [Orbaceae bacterium ESL0721]